MIELHGGKFFDIMGGTTYLISTISLKGTTYIQGGEVVLERFVQIGAQCMLFPNIHMAEGSVLGAKSMLKSNVEVGTKWKSKYWTVYAGVPARPIKLREKGLLNYI